MIYVSTEIYIATICQAPQAMVVGKPEDVEWSEMKKYVQTQLACFALSINGSFPLAPMQLVYRRDDGFIITQHHDSLDGERFTSDADPKKRGESAWREGKHKHKTNARGNKPEKLFISIIKVNSNSMMFAAAFTRFSLCNPNKSEGMCEREKSAKICLQSSKKKREKECRGWGYMCERLFISLVCYGFAF